MSTKTSTVTKREISKRGNVVIIKEVETTTTYVDGKEPSVKEVTRIQEFNGEEDFKRLPEDIQRQFGVKNTRVETKAVAAVSKTAAPPNFAEDCLAEHNKYRKLHKVEPLKLSKQLVRESELRAQQLAEKDEMHTRADHKYGENLSCLWSSDPGHMANASEIVTRWYSEEKNYDYNNEPTIMKCGHFSQLVWANSKEFGVAAAKSKSNKIYVVATYDPPGNFIGNFRKNVHPPHANGSISKVKNGNGFLEKTETPSTTVEKYEALTDDPNASDLNKECVACHNNYRRKHGVPPLRYSKELADYAQSWANELARLDRMQHSSQRKYGENLYCYKSSNPQAVASPSDACQSWYNEFEQYDFNSEPKSLATGHFTQMVWKTTEEVGMGRAKSKSGLQIIVASYNPPGNFIGNFRANVLKPVH